jgi:hypothetical protein
MQQQYSTNIGGSHGSVLAFEFSVTDAPINRSINLHRSASVYFYTFVAARLVHTVSYLNEIQVCRCDATCHATVGQLVLTHQPSVVVVVVGYSHSAQSATLLACWLPLASVSMSCFMLGDRATWAMSIFQALPCFDSGSMTMVALPAL